MRRFAINLFAAVSLLNVPAQVHAQNLPNPIVIQSPALIRTLDGDGNSVGRVWNFVLTFSRQYTPNNQMITPFQLTYWYGNRNAGETWRGSQYFTIDLLDGNGAVVVQDVLGHIGLPRGQCWYSGGAQQSLNGTTNFDYTDKNVMSMRINVSRVTGTQTGC